MMGIPYNTKRAYKKLNTCHECGEKFKKSETLKSGKAAILHIYDDPWATEPSLVKVHSANESNCGTRLDKLTDTSWADFRYFTCETCERLIISQCPYNGWRSYRHITENGAEICAKCYQDDILKNGQPSGAFDNRIPGDFFETGAIVRAGYEIVPGFNNVFINNAASLKRFCDKAKSLITSGHFVVTDYESMGIGGSEGYVSLYSKPAEPIGTEGQDRESYTDDQDRENYTSNA